MILRGDRLQWYEDTIAIASDESVFIHPGAPDQDGNTLGTSAYNHIILKDYEIWGATTKARLEGITLHYLGGGTEDLLTPEINDALIMTYKQSMYSYKQHLLTEVNLLQGIEFHVSNSDGEVTVNILIKIRYEMVK